MAKAAHDIKRHMVAGRGAAVEIDAVQRRRARKDDIAFLLEFARQRLLERFAAFDAAAGQVEAGHISVAHQQHAVVRVDDEAAHAQRHRPRKQRAQGDEPRDEAAAFFGLVVGHVLRRSARRLRLWQIARERSRGCALRFDWRRPAGALEAGRMTFLLAHLSDAHIGPIPRPNLAELLGKRVTGYVNWLYKRAAQHDMGVLERIVADHEGATTRSHRHDRRHRQYRARRPNSHWRGSGSRRSARRPT